MYLSPTLQITFLGTGTSSGVPMIACNCEVCTSANKKDKRLRSSILVKYNNTTLVIDTTPDFRYQMLRENVQNLDGVLIYANEFTQHELKREFYYVFAEHKYPGIPEIDLINIEAESFEIDGLQITPIKVWHLNMPVLGFRLGDFTYITDANRIDDAEKEKIKGSKVLVLNALRHTEHISHFTLQQAIDLGKELQIPQVYFTHISHQLGLHDIVTSTLEKGFALAYDGLTIEV
jgi:phosphoribosyl 1,2-cyclic phosphate phosphodiesterase